MSSTRSTPLTSDISLRPLKKMYHGSGTASFLEQSFFLFSSFHLILPVPQIAYPLSIIKMQLSMEG